MLENPLISFGSANLEKTVSDLSLSTVTAASILLVLLIIVAINTKRWPQLKLPLFSVIALIVTATTLTISGATIYLNTKSATGGPVHWHADFEIWACGNQLNLRNPLGVLNNKIGTPTLHEHNDKRIHLEGVPVTLPEDASLGKFMSVVGGEISPSSLVVPLTEGKYFEEGHSPVPELVQPFVQTKQDGSYAHFVSGQPCGDTSAPSEVQAFAFRYDAENKTYRQTKLQDPANYEISHHSDVPPGDCIIMEFAPPKDRTNYLCRQYGIRDQDKCQDFGVPANKRHECSIREVQ